MPKNPSQPDPVAALQVPTHQEVLILGRAEGGLDGAHGGVCFYEKGEEVRLQPGDVAEVPVKVAASLIADGLAVDPNSVDPDPDPDVDPDTDPDSDLKDAA